MIDATINNAELQVRSRDDGSKELAFRDPDSAIVVRVLLPPDACEKVAAALTGSSVVVAPAGALPKGPGVNGSLH